MWSFTSLWLVGSCKLVSSSDKAFLLDLFLPSLLSETGGTLSEGVLRFVNIGGL